MRGCTDEFWCFDDYLEYPITKATDFYDQAYFYEIETNLAHLEKLISLGDIFIMEPTGNYSKLWVNSLLDAGKEVRFISPIDKAYDNWLSLCY